MREIDENRPCKPGEHMRLTQTVIKNKICNSLFWRFYEHFGLEFQIMLTFLKPKKKQCISDSILNPIPDFLRFVTVTWTKTYVCTTETEVDHKNRHYALAFWKPPEQWCNKTKHCFCKVFRKNKQTITQNNDITRVKKKT